jgi:hypothetical protein
VGGNLRSILAFFRDTLSGNIYTIVSLVCLFLILVCVYLLRKINTVEKEKAKKEAAFRVVIVDPSGSNKRVEINIASNDVATDIPIDSMASVTNVLAAQDIYNSDDAVLASDTSTEDVIVEPKKDNTPTLINPMEVAMVSSTLNVIGATSEQKSAIAKNTASDILDNVSDTNTADDSTLEG